MFKVSWIRHRDIHILTVGSYTYTTDQRFQAIHRKNSDEWTLQIKWAQKRDGGMYECQISTQPVKSFFVNLSVVGEYIIFKDYYRKYLDTKKVFFPFQHYSNRINNSNANN